MVHRSAHARIELAIEVGHDARIEDRASFSRAHLFEFCSGQIFDALSRRS